MQDLDFFIRFALTGGVMTQPERLHPLCTYHKDFSGRSVSQITDSQSYIREKYAYLYERYGEKFRLDCDRSLLRNRYRFAMANNNAALGRMAQAQRLMLKIRSLLSAS